MARGRPPDPREDHNRILSSQMAEWRRAELLIRCDGQPHVPRVVGRWCAELERLRPGQSLRWWCLRLRCTACGGEPSGVALRVPGRDGDRWAALRGYGTPGQEGGPVVEEGDTKHYEWWRDHPLLQGRLF